MRRSGLAVWFLAVLIIINLVFVSFLYLKLNVFNSSTNGQVAGVSENVSSASSSKKVTPVVIYPLEVKSNVMFFGDVFWGRYVQDWSEKSTLKEAYPFSGLSTFEREKYQVWIGSLNCPLTTNNVTSKQQDETLMFNCRPEYLTEARKWFDVFSLANSHVDNMEGEIGFNSTKKYLQEHNFQFFSHHNKDREDDICEVVNFNTYAPYSGVDILKDGSTRKGVYTVPVALCGYHNTFALPTESQLNQITKYTEYFPTFAYGNQGKEYPLTADGLQVKYFREMIDKGADAVIGKSAHVVQNTEAYKGKLILYSLGNFVYDQQFSPDVTQAVGLNMKLDFTVDENLDKWQEISPNCQKFKDDCYLKAKEMGLKKPGFKVSYDLVASDNSGKLAKKASDAILQKLLIRTNWAKTTVGLSN